MTDQQEAPQTFKVFAGNIPYATTDDTLKEHFKDAEGIVGAHVVNRRGRSLGYGFVEFSTQEQANSSIAKFNETSIGERQITVEMARNPDAPRERPRRRFNRRPRPQREEGGEERPEGERRSFRRRPRRRSERESTNEGSSSEKPSEGSSSEKPRPPRERKERPKREEKPKEEKSKEEKPRQDKDKAKQERPKQERPKQDKAKQDKAKEEKPKEDRPKKEKAKDQESAPASEENRGPRGYGRRRRVEGEGEGEVQREGEERPRGFRRGRGGRFRGGPRRPQSDRPPREDREPSSTTIYVSNLPFAIEEQALMEHFKEFHPVKAQIARFRGRSKGFGFVELETNADQKNAVAAKDNSDLDGRALAVKVAFVDLSTAAVAEKEEEKKD